MKGIIKKIDQINFGLMSPDQIREMSVVNITRPDTYDEDGYPIEHGLMDSRLGVIDPSLKCRTCGEKGGECQGHFGIIELARPVIHVGFGDDIHKILRSTCNECGRVLLDDDEIEEITEKLNALQEAGESPEDLIKGVYKKCKTRKDKEECPHCGAEQNNIKIINNMGILEERKEYDENGEVIKDANGYPVTTDYDLTAVEVREKLERIPDEDAYVLGVNPEVARPEWMVLTILPVPPVTVRPSITLDTGERSEDDLTHKLVDILRINQRLIENMDAGAPQLIVEDLWQLLQYHVTTYFDNEASGVPPARHRSGRPLKTLAQRLKGKEGRFRSNLSGKRVNFSARTVISPDPNISINEVGVPEMIAKEVTVPTYANEWNINDLREAILNGSNVHPGANYVRKYNPRIDDYNKVRVLDTNKEMVAENLDFGDIVMRHLKDGDIVLFNRQPSLHRGSIMAHEVRVLPYKTFRLNPCVCPPYNADFDGDEMNMHVLQTDESRAEAKSLMSVQEHILSPRFGGPIIGAIHDHISGAYLLTRAGVEIPEDEAFQMMRKSHLINNPYVNKKHMHRKYRNWTGKELFSLLLPDDLNMNYRAEICKKCEEGCSFEACEHDAYVVIKDGQLTHGAIDEAAYGSFSGKILDTIIKEYGPSRAKEFLDRSTDLAICGIMKTGITTSTNDEEIPKEAIEVIDTHLDNAEQKVDRLIDAYEMGELQPLPGRSEKETLEIRIVQVLGEARDTAGDIAAGYLTMGKQDADDTYDHVMAVENHSVIMAKTGARGSMLNLAQITACVGQQSVRGGRLTRGYLNRTLPHFRKHELGARAKGFVHSSYKEGLDPVEFFFHAMGGREGLVDTAIRTAQSGYMQRRLVNALQDLNVRSDGLVTDNKGQVIQTVFGEDGIDPAKSDFGKVANLDKLIDEMRINGGELKSKKDYDTYITHNPVTTKLIDNKSKNKNKQNKSKIQETKPESKAKKDTESNKEKTNKTKKSNSSKEKPKKAEVKHILQAKNIRAYEKLLLKLPDIIEIKTKKYTEISEKFIEMENKLDDLEEKEFKKLYLISGDFDAELKKLILSFNETYKEFNSFPTEIINYEREFKKFKPFNKIKDLSKFDEELSKLEKLSDKIYSYTLDKFENNLFEYDKKYIELLNEFKHLEEIYEKRLKITDQFKKDAENIKLELDNASDIKEKIDSLSNKINQLDDKFASIYAEDIDKIENSLNLIERNYNSYVSSQESYLNSINQFIDKSKEIYTDKELDNETSLVFALKEKSTDLNSIQNEFANVLVKYYELNLKESEFKDNYKEKIEKYKTLYSEIKDIIKIKTFDYNRILDEYKLMKNKLDILDKEINKKQHIINPIFKSKINKLILDHDNSFNEINEKVFEIIQLELEFKVYETHEKIKDISNLENELPKLEQLFNKINSYNPDNIKNNLLEYENRYDVLLGEFNDLEKIYQKCLGIADQFKKDAENIKLELDKNSDFKEKLSILSNNLNKLDSIFALAYSEDIDIIENSLKSIEIDYDSYVSNQEALLDTVNQFLEKSEEFYSEEELDKEASHIFALKEKNTDFYSINNDFANITVKYYELNLNESRFKEDYHELYDLDMEINYLDESILQNITGFKEYLNTELFKINFNEKDLDDAELKAISDNIIIDIINKVLTVNLDFNSIFDNYANDYISKNKKKSKESESVINVEIMEDDSLGKKDNLKSEKVQVKIESGEEVKITEPDEDIEFKENYKELVDLGFKSNDFDDSSLYNYTKFNDFRNGIVYKFKSNSLDENAIALINKNIISDISNKNIKDSNFANIFDKYVDLYKKGKLDIESFKTVNENIKHEEPSNSIKSVEKINNKISEEELKKKDSVLTVLGFEIKGMDLTAYNDETIKYAKETMEREFISNELSSNDVENNFKYYLDKKNREKQNLNELKLIIDNPNIPSIKQFLKDEEMNLIYDLIKEKIIGEGVDHSVYFEVEKEMENKIRSNQNDARNALREYTENKQQFIEKTGLDELQYYTYIDEVHSIIIQNKIRASDINDEFINETTKNFKLFGKI